MIDMRVRKDYRIDLFYWNGKRFVLLGRLTSLSLEHPAIQSHGMTIYMQEVAGACDFARRSYECYLQSGSILRSSRYAQIKSSDGARPAT